MLGRRLAALCRRSLRLPDLRWATRRRFWCRLGGVEDGHALDHERVKQLMRDGLHRWGDIEEARDAMGAAGGSVTFARDGPWQLPDPRWVKDLGVEVNTLEREPLNQRREHGLDLLPVATLGPSIGEPVEDVRAVAAVGVDRRGPAFVAEGEGNEASGAMCERVFGVAAAHPGRLLGVEVQGEPAITNHVSVGCGGVFLLDRTCAVAGTRQAILFDLLQGYVHTCGATRLPDRGVGEGFVVVVIEIPRDGAVVPTPWLSIQSA